MPPSMNVATPNFVVAPPVPLVPPLLSLAVYGQGDVTMFWLAVAQKLSFAPTGGTGFLSLPPSGGACVQDAGLSPPPMRFRCVEALPPELTHS